MAEQALRRSGMTGSIDEWVARFGHLRNLLNVGVFDPRDRFRGRWDRNRPGQGSAVVLAVEGSSPGMMDGAIDSGAWRFCLEIHQVLVPCDCVLRISASETPPPARSAPALVRRRQREGTWLRGDLHFHSEHS